MQNGEKAQKKTERHTEEWVDKNREKWDGWIAEARNNANYTITTANK